MADLIADPHLRLHLLCTADSLHLHPPSMLQQAWSLISDALKVAASALLLSLLLSLPTATPLSCLLPTRFHLRCAPTLMLGARTS
jgi:hypothetical protein